MNSSYCISEAIDEKESSFLRFSCLQMAGKGKISFDESHFAKTYGADATRFYSKAGILLIHLLKSTQFEKWFDPSISFGVYGAVREGSFDFENSSDEMLELQKLYGPRQYFKSFSAFTVYAPVNYFKLSAPVLTFTSSSERFSQALDEAKLDLKTGCVNQILLLASNLSESREKETESLFSIASNDWKALDRISQEMEDSRWPENEIFRDPLKIFKES